MTSTAPTTAAASITALANTASTTQVGATANDSNMNEFLTLLTAQLKNQDPTNPTDPTQFVAQLAQFSTVEQLTQSNTTLDTISKSLSGLSLGQYSSMINQTVTSNAAAVTVPASGSVSTPITFNLTSTSLSNVQVQVKNSSGVVVNTIPISGNSGSITFNGNDSKGNALPAGDYDLSLIGTGTGGKSQSAGTLAMTSQVTGVVQGTSGAWELQLQNGLTIDATTVTSLKKS
jgi:flagellar basal-body rod modification protein FlgD